MVAKHRSPLIWRRLRDKHKIVDAMSLLPLFPLFCLLLFFLSTLVSCFTESHAPFGPTMSNVGKAGVKAVTARTFSGIRDKENYTPYWPKDTNPLLVFTLRLFDVIRFTAAHREDILRTSMDLCKLTSLQAGKH